MKSTAKRGIARCRNCGNTIYFWREMGKLRCQICDNSLIFTLKLKRKIRTRLVAKKNQIDSLIDFL